MKLPHVESLLPACVPEKQGLKRKRGEKKLSVFSEGLFPGK